MPEKQTPADGGGRCGNDDQLAGAIDCRNTPDRAELQAQRERLPSRRRHRDRRTSEIAAFLYEGRRYRASISRFEDGSIGEIFLDAEKFGSDVAIHANESAILASIALQLGATPSELRHSIRGPIAAALALFSKAPA